MFRREQVNNGSGFLRDEVTLTVAFRGSLKTANRPWFRIFGANIQPFSMRGIRFDPPERGEQKSLYGLI